MHQRPNYKPMGQLLREAGVDIVSLAVVYGKDSRDWGCRFSEAYEGNPRPRCLRVVRSRSWRRFRPKFRRGIRLDAYDGTFFAGTTSPSPPAVEMEMEPVE